VIDPRLAWFALGASCSAVVFGWLWHTRFSRRMGPPKGSLGYPFWDYIPDSQGDTSNHSWRGTSSITFPDPEPERQPINPYTGGRVVDIHGRTIGRIPRSQGDTPNPPPTAP